MEIISFRKEVEIDCETKQVVGPWKEYRFWVKVGHLEKCLKKKQVGAIMSSPVRIKNMNTPTFHKKYYKAYQKWLEDKVEV